MREAEIELVKARSVREVCKHLGVTDQTYYRWRKEYGGIRTDQARRLKELERENGRLRAESLNENWFLSFDDAREKVQSWRRH